MKVEFLNLKRINDSFSPLLEEAAMRVISGGWYLHGSETRAFESEWSQFVGTSYAVGCASGLDALALVLSAWKLMYGWKEGSEVVVPANTFIATVLAVTRAGLRPVLCDVDPRDGLATAQTMQACLSDRTVCLIPVHLYGQLCDMAPLRELSDIHGLRILEDACQAHGAIDAASGRGAGAWGHAAAFSFYPGKNLGALGDAGCVTTDDEELATLVSQLANYGQRTKYVHDFQGINSRMDEVQAAMLRMKLQRLSSDNERRRAVASRYLESLSSWAASVPGVSLPNAHLGTDNVWHIFPLRVPCREAWQARLAEQGVQTLIHYPIPVHHQKAYSELSQRHYPAAEQWCAEELSLPMSPLLTPDEVSIVVDALKRLTV